MPVKTNGLDERLTDRVRSGVVTSTAIAVVDDDDLTDDPAFIDLSEVSHDHFLSSLNHYVKLWGVCF